MKHEAMKRLINKTNTHPKGEREVQKIKYRATRKQHPNA
jgi:hypothetical protein